MSAEDPGGLLRAKSLGKAQSAAVVRLLLRHTEGWTTKRVRVGRHSGASTCHLHMV